MPFTGENAVMMVYRGHPPSGRRCVSNPSPRAQLIAVGDTEAQGCNGTSLFFPYPIHIYIYIYIYQKHILQLIPREKIKKKMERQWGEQPEATGAMAVPSQVVRTGARGQRLLQTFQDEVSHRETSQVDLGSWRCLEWVACLNRPGHRKSP
jgi:hypothetical protein